MIINLNLKQTFVFSSFVLLFWGCETVILEDFSVPYEGKKGVLIGFVNPENGLFLYAGSTVPVLNSLKDSLKQPILDLLEDGVSVEKPSYIGRNTWISNIFRPKMGKFYQLSLKSDGIEPLFTDKVLIPAAVRIDTVRVFLVNNDSTSRMVHIDFKDPIGKNYYGIRILQYYNDTLVEGYGNRILPLEGSTVFNDTDFEGSHSVQKEQVYLGRGGYRYHYANHFKVTLYNLSKSGYDFLNGLAIARLTANDYFTEPSKIPSNVTGGYGCLGAYHFTTFDVKF